ncbi:uncharacterized protein P884DRAFT_95976 [Thermothelomyces heterothallicus CBS 202.75]|uniref:uncharacterized protein n=1 Tax=Thermothelomyces heterothallicus CBS 202.75 TaxID=1149848 RepID=UPI0037449A32
MSTQRGGLDVQRRYVGGDLARCGQPRLWAIMGRLVRWLGKRSTPIVSCLHFGRRGTHISYLH